MKEAEFTEDCKLEKKEIARQIYRAAHITGGFQAPFGTNY